MALSRNRPHQHRRRPLLTFVSGIVALILVSDSAPGQHPLGPHRSRDDPSLNLEAVDFSPLVDAARKRNHRFQEDEEDLHSRVAGNFQFIYLNKLNRRGFLAPPDPQRVIDRILAILRFHEELAQSIQEGRMIMADRGGRSERQRVVRQIGQLSRDLKKNFGEYFLEAHSASHQITLMREGGDGQFVHFLIQSERILRHLDWQLEDYFFSDSPGSVSVSNYETASIGVLSESLSRLSDLTARRLDN